ncbi:hypothetical protein ACWD5R_06550 [Streptomyces sp. NPDC002514]|uniref:hypothetical protein n=1 Tax=Streptomyces sp. NPDC001270 TaxID=3364554 RepID=UPI00367BAFAF
MSRETDTPSSGPNGHGGAAYPSGTPPYGTPMAADGGTEAGRSATQPEERKTETTLTTRIRINIPGSRPIPPVVVRTPVAETDGPGTDADPQPASAPPPPSPAEVPAEPAAAAQEKTSDWFAPRKSGPAKGGPGGGSGNAAQAPGGSAAGGAPATGPAPGAPGAARPGGGRPGGVVGAMGAPGATRPSGGAGKGAGLPGATGGPVAPGHGGGTGSFDVTEALAAGPLGGGARPGQDGPGEPRRDDLPYFAENGPGGAERNGFDGPHGQGGPGGPGGFTGPRGPAGPTSGPVTGDGPLVPPAVGGPNDQGDHGLAPGEPFGGPDTGRPAAPAGPGGPGVRPGAGVGAHRGLGPGGGLSDDTAILTPQKQVPEPPVPGYGTHVDNVSGHTVTSGIPVVPPGPGAPFAPGGAAEGPVPHTAPKLPEPVAQNVPQAKPKKKGRSKLVLLGGVVVVAGAGVYGAGLLMNHSDVPKGTTVLGVDIGGGTRDNAVNKLDDTFGGLVGKPLKLSVGGRTVSLDPDNAGLQFDYQATVSAAAHSDYNPVSVIGTLFGQKREIQPVMPVDEEKLQAALKDLGGESGSVTDGTIKFESGKAVAVYGKAGKGIDAGQSAQSVEQAYRTLVATGTAAPVTVPTTTQQPTVSNAEVDREMKEFAEPAMSQTVTVQTDPAHSVSLSPQNSLWKFLRVTAVNGKLVDKPDLTALQNLYGQTFDGVLITRANGEKTPVTPQDVYGALRTALTSKTSRISVIDTDPK